MVHGLCLKLAREGQHVISARDTEATPLEGFIEFHLKRPTSLDVMQVRLVGLETKRVPGAFAKVVVSVDASFKYVFEPRPLEWEGSLPLIKGHHIFGFVLDVPKWLPPSQDSEHVHLRYEVLATCKEASRSWYRAASMESVRRPLQIAIHPSTSSRLNFLDETLLPLEPLPSGAHLRATLDSPNARLGGCFWLRLQVRAAAERTDGEEEAAATIRLDRVCVKMRQLWTAPGSRVSQGTGPEAVLYDKAGAELETAAKAGEAGSSSGPSNRIHPGLQTAIDGGSSSVVSGTSTPKEHVQDAEDGLRISTTFAANIDFPEPAPPFDLSCASIQTWQPTTLPETRSSIRFEHQIEVAVEFCVLKAGCAEEKRLALVGRSITIVGPDLQSANVELPLYSDLVAQDFEVASAKGKAYGDPEAPPPTL